MHREDGVRSYSVARTFQNGFCAVCSNNALEMREIETIEMYEPGRLETYKVTAVFICAGCLYRIAGQNDSRKEVFCGIVQDKPGAELE